jgi:5-hydroxyisourate hydrolase-like protein (transthyretin family)
LSLARASGSLSGTVTTLADGQPAPGVTVTVTSGEDAISTVTQSAGNVGSWTVSGLAIPSTYTVTFERADLKSQTVAVSLDAAGNPSTGPLSVGMQSAFAIVRGSVTQQSIGGAGSAVGEATIELSSATDTYQVTTASTPSSEVGLFEIRNVTPGTYTLSAARKGTRPTSVIVTVTAGQVLDVNPVLIPPATLSGTVTNLASSGPAGGITVTLYLASEYPATIYQQTTTDANGRYSFADLDAPQAYVVEISNPATGPLASKTLPLNASEAGIADLSFGSPTGVEPGSLVTATATAGGP